MKRNMQGDVASVQWLGKQLTRDFNLLPRSLLLPLSSSSCCSSSRIRSNVKQENYRRASFSTKQHVKQGKAYTNYDEICKMYLNLKTILLNNYDDRGFVINSQKENVKRTFFFDHSMQPRTSLVVLLLSLCSFRVFTHWKCLNWRFFVTLRFIAFNCCFFMKHLLENYTAGCC